MKTVESDMLIIADSNKLLQYADSKDLQCRNSEIIEDLYHADWFFEYKNGNYFEAPAIYITEGVIKFINGRHRTILLSRHINVFPVLVGNLDMDINGGTASTKSLYVLKNITVNKFSEHTTFKNLPDLKFGSFSQA